eukprot:GHVL01010203.1.p1 GENE.GHVL01010203.1~~GHVL01010203.1.p1  ORF type:complete len:245 (+),score=23.48 GHVL01010203.1:21-755(+)
MLQLSRYCQGPPKSPRNVFFPWQNFILARSGHYIEPNRAAFRVPVNMTKPQIIQYFRRIYNAKAVYVNTYVKTPKKLRAKNNKGNFYKRQPLYKKAYVRFEETIPDTVKMMSSSMNVGRNPIMIKKNYKYATRKSFRWNPKRLDLIRYLGGHDKQSENWRHPITTLLRGNDSQSPLFEYSEQERVLPPDPTKPYFHHTKARTPIPGTPTQEHPYMDLKPWRRVKVARNTLTSNKNAVQEKKLNH